VEALASMQEQAKVCGWDVALQMDVELHFAEGTELLHKPDIDNLCKFVLDATQGNLCVEDR